MVWFPEEDARDAAVAAAARQLLRDSVSIEGAVGVTTEMLAAAELRCSEAGRLEQGAFEAGDVVYLVSENSYRNTLAY